MFTLLYHTDSKYMCTALCACTVFYWAGFFDYLLLTVLTVRTKTTEIVDVVYVNSVI
jgi:hypothetical protein